MENSVLDLPPILLAFAESKKPLVLSDLIEILDFRITVHRDYPARLTGETVIISVLPKLLFEVGRYLQTNQGEFNKSKDPCNIIRAINKILISVILSCQMVKNWSKGKTFSTDW